MAGSSLLALLDDITTLLDDIAALSKTAASKTAGVLGDDLALNAQQVGGVRAERELPVVWAVAKGSFRNKLILVPAALALSALLPWLVTPLLMLGGAYLCYEGFEKLAHRFLHGAAEDEAEHEAITEALLDPAVDMVAFEQEKIAGAIRTDFVLSAEIIVIALGTVSDAAFATRAAVVAGIAVLMTVGVYGFVAAIVKLDDMGLWLLQRAPAGGAGQLQRWLGRGLLAFAPWLMRALGVLGTVAMFMVGGSILLHGWPAAHDSLHHAAEAVAGWPLGTVLAALLPALANIAAGVTCGAVVLAVVSAGQGLWRRFK